MEDSTRYNDQRMAAVGTGPFKASTQNKTVRSLDMMIPAVDQCLGTSAGHWGRGGGGRRWGVMMKAPVPFKASTQNKTVRSLDVMIPAVDQWLGTSAGHWRGVWGGNGDGTGPFIMQVMGIGY